MTTPEDALCAIERVAAGFARHELTTLWAVVDAYRAGSPDLARHVVAARDDAAQLGRHADAANECGPGFPRDDPGPWYWSCLASLTEAAALAPSDPGLALHHLACAERAAAHLARERGAPSPTKA